MMESKFNRIHKEALTGNPGHNREMYERKLLWSFSIPVSNSVGGINMRS